MLHDSKLDARNILASGIRNVKKENIKDIHTDDTVMHKFVAAHGKSVRPPAPACRVCIRHPIPSPCSLALTTHNSSLLLSLSAPCWQLYILWLFFFLIWSLMRCVSDINHESKSVSCLAARNLCTGSFFIVGFHSRACCHRWCLTELW